MLGVRRVVLALCAALASCFYLEGINDRPSAEILRLPTSALVRGGRLQVEARVNDPNGDPVSFLWTARACGPAAASCDPVALAEGTDPAFTVTIPRERADGSALATLRVTLDVTDALGARAEPSQVLIADISNLSPALALQTTGLLAQGYPAQLPVWFNAQISDDDDGAEAVDLVWTVDVPRGVPVGSWSFAAEPDPPPAVAGTREERRRLVAEVPGVYAVHVVATDALGATASASSSISIAPDAPPCLRLTAPGSAALLLDQPRRLEVLVVEDDLAPYPPATDGYRGAATFRWSIAEAGGAFAVVDGGASALELDPAAYAPGTQLAARVEIDDGAGRSLPCDDAEPTCSFAGDGCQQRQTWTLEVR